MIKPSIWLAIAITMLYSCSTLNVTKVSNDVKTVTKRNGIFYNLPKIDYDVIVNYEKIEVSPSRYYKLYPSEFTEAVKFIDGPFKFYAVEQTTFKLKDVVVSPRTIADPAQNYFIEFRRENAWFLKKKYSFELGSGLFLTNGTSTSEDNTSDVIAATLNTALKSVTALYSPAPKGALPGAVPTAADTILDIVKKINEIRKSKHEIYVGKITALNYQNSPIELLLKRLDNQERELMDLLTGEKDVTTLKQTFTYEPKEGETIPFYFNNKTGPNTEKSGDPIQFTLGTNDIKKTTDNFFLLKGGVIKSKNHGIYYRIPYSGVLTIRRGQLELLRSTVVVPQLGSVGFLPSKVAVRLNELNYKLDGSTGALVKFDANAEGFKVETLKELYTTGEGLPAQWKKPKEEAATVNEYEAIEKEIKQLELDFKKKLLQAKIDSIAAANIK